MATRLWSLTIFPPEGADLHPHFLRVSQEKDCYICAGKETCPKTGRMHYQMCVYRPSKFSLKQLQRAFPGCHAEKARGNFQQNYDYCTKDGKFAEYGERPHQGVRNDLSEIVALAPQISLKTAVLTGKVTNMQQLKFFERVSDMLCEPHDGPRTVKYYHGDSGSGKSMTARQHLTDYDICTLEADGKVTGYTGKSQVLFDDMPILNEVQYRTLLKLTDRYKTRVRILYGDTWWNASLIYITTEHDVHTIAPKGCNPTQLIRRIQEIFCFSKV